MRKLIRPAAVKLGITAHLGWHTFRHTYSSLLRANRVDIKVMQELLRHASSRVTLDTHTQAVNSQKREAQSKVVQLLRGPMAAGARATRVRLCFFVPLVAFGLGAEILTFNTRRPKNR